MFGRFIIKNPTSVHRFLTGQFHPIPIKLQISLEARLFQWYSSSASALTLKLDQTNLSKYIIKIQNEYAEIVKVPDHGRNPRYIELQSIIDVVTKQDRVHSNLKNLKELIDSDDKDLSQLAKDEKKELEEQLGELDVDLIEALTPVDREDTFDSMVLEVQAGVGGQEAMLFAQEMFQMYCSFIDFMGWEYEIADFQTTDIGGIRRGTILVNGTESFKHFKYEAGVHRVQRIPATEKAGRIHTSTVSVVALPQPSEIDVQIDAKDLKIETKRSTGAGGQHVNTTDSCVRIVHLPTNIMVECQMERSQIKNRKLAMTRLRAILYQRELDQQRTERSATRKSQVRSNNRNEKIRTYNFNQDRITDHRLNGIHFHNLKGFLENGQDLSRLIDQLDQHSKIQILEDLIRHCN